MHSTDYVCCLPVVFLSSYGVWAVWGQGTRLQFYALEPAHLHLVFKKLCVEWGKHNQSCSQYLSDHLFSVKFTFLFSSVQEPSKHFPVSLFPKSGHENVFLKNKKMTPCILSFYHMSGPIQSDLLDSSMWYLKQFLKKRPLTVLISERGKWRFSKATNFYGNGRGGVRTSDPQAPSLTYV